MAINALADRAVRFVAGIVGIVGTFILAYAVFTLHERVFSQHQKIHVMYLKSQTKSIPTPTIHQAERDLLRGERMYPSEKKLTVVAMVLIGAAAVLVTIADIIDLADKASNEDDNGQLRVQN